MRKVYQNMGNKSVISFVFNKRKNVISLKWITERSYFTWRIFKVFIEKTIYFKKNKIIKINDI